MHGGRLKDMPKFLMNLGAGAPCLAPYTFSDPTLDLAIISLDQRDSAFADELLALGYNPISIEQIADEPSHEGADVFAVGYPAAISIIDKRPLNPDEIPWASSTISEPVFSFGKISMLHQELPFYWCDMSIYPGNSGGPVIENGKLVGIVIQQATIPVEGIEKNMKASGITTRIPFARITKIRPLRFLLEQQISKDKKSLS